MSDPLLRQCTCCWGGPGPCPCFIPADFPSEFNAYWPRGAPSIEDLARIIGDKQTSVSLPRAPNEWPEPEGDFDG